MFRKRLLSGAAVMLLLLSGCNATGSGGNLKPGVYPVQSAEYEVEDDDYELQIQGHGEYDVLFNDLYIVMDPSRKEMLLEIAADQRQTLYLTGPRDLKRDREKKKETKKTTTPPKQAPANNSTQTKQAPASNSTPAK